MEILRALVTAAVMGAFFAIVWWAYAPSRKADWERKGLLPDDDNPKTGTDHVFGADGNRGLSLIAGRDR